MIATKTRSQAWSHKLYVKPETKREKIGLWLKGYRVWNHGIIRGHFWVKEEHYNESKRS